ncbi:hypothetical protein HY625_03420 [Candidatus Uhrbacteria bacterium]|nr:hypothetical protein [Candidatus Uhrbacteria bacterium]
MKKFSFTTLLLIILFVGLLFTQQTVFAQILGGKILPTSGIGLCPPAVDPFGRICGLFYYVVGPPRPTLLPTPATGVLWPRGPQYATIGRWFLGRAVGGVVVIGGLGF